MRKRRVRYDDEGPFAWPRVVSAVTMALSCRFYKHRYPKLEDVVMVNVRSIAEMGAYVSLLEYDNIEGMIMLSELSRRRIRSINRLVRIGRNECVVVIRVDEEKGEQLVLVHTHFILWSRDPMTSQVTSISPRGGYRRRRSKSVRRSTPKERL